MTADTRLTPDEKKKFADWLKAHGIKPCPMCGKRNWAIGDHLIAAIPYAGGEAVTGGTLYPQAMLVCGNCAHTAYFNAVVVGLISRAADNKE